MTYGTVTKWYIIIAITIVYYYFESANIVVAFKFFFGSMIYTHTLGDSSILKPYTFSVYYTNATLKKLIGM
jgi:hypothetical protein